MTMRLKNMSYATLKAACLAGAVLAVPAVSLANAAVKAPQPKVKVIPIQQIVAKVRAKRSDRLADYIQNRYQVAGSKARLIVREADRQAARHGLEPELILAVIAVESTFRERAVSRLGARGLMQIMAKYHPQKVRNIGGPQALFEPGKNIAAGSQILVEYLELSKGDLTKALLRYNGSLNSRNPRYAKKVLKVYRELQQASVVT